MPRLTLPVLLTLLLPGHVLAQEKPIRNMLPIDKALIEALTPDKTVRNKSPEEAFRALNAAAKRKDWRVYFGHTTQESQIILAGQYVFMSGIFPEAFSLPAGEAQTKAIKSLLKKHSLTMDRFKAVQEKIKEIEAGADAKKVISLFSDLGRVVQNRTDFFVDYMKILHIAEDPSEKSPFDNFFVGTLGNLKIDSDTASATLTNPNRSEPLFFRREDNSWKLDYHRLLEEKGLK